jgi:hypothetical protein
MTWSGNIDKDNIVGKNQLALVIKPETGGAP